MHGNIYSSVLCVPSVGSPELLMKSYCQCCSHTLNFSHLYFIVVIRLIGRERLEGDSLAN